MFMMKYKKSRKLKKSKDNTLVSCNFGEKYQVAGLMSFNFLYFT